MEEPILLTFILFRAVLEILIERTLVTFVYWKDVTWTALADIFQHVDHYDVI